MKTYREIKNNRLRKSLNEKNDCTVIALATACSISYNKAHQMLAEYGRKPRQGTLTRWVLCSAHRLGFKVEAIENHGYKTFGQVEKAAMKGKLKGKYFVTSRDHMAAIKYGKLNDWSSAEMTGKSNRTRVDQLFKVYKPRTTPSQK